jgi:hypothetical protein
MNRSDTDPRLAPVPVRLAKPLIEGFLRSRYCAPEHRWHARSTLPVLALAVAMTDEPSTVPLPWATLDPDALANDPWLADPAERLFLRDLLDISAAFYLYLADSRALSLERATWIATRLAERAGLVRRAA